MPLTQQQREVIDDVKTILSDSGIVSISHIPTDVFTASLISLESQDQTNTLPPFQIGYTPPTPFFFDKSARPKVTRLAVSAVDAIIDHPLGALVEYPFSGLEPGHSIAHRFAIDPRSYIDPRRNIQYSLGRDSKGGHPNTGCLIFSRGVSVKEPVLCNQIKTSCNSIRCCRFVGPSVSRYGPSVAIEDTSREVFEKTLGLYETLLMRGCHGFSGELEISGSDSETELEGDSYPLPVDSRSRVRSECEGQIQLFFNMHGAPFIKCEHYAKQARGHLYLRNLNEYDSYYLQALLHNNRTVLGEIEVAAAQNGYGPLISCSFVAACREQKQLCSNWHRYPNGRLERGILEAGVKCPTRFEIYVPNDIYAHPEIIIISRKPHSHPDPLPTKTPGLIKSLFTSLLQEMDSGLADLTPRKLALDSAFMAKLRSHLNWKGTQDPSLSMLHPSLGNFDHTRRIIEKERDKYFPDGTGLDGVFALYKKHMELTREEQYIRLVERFEIDRHKPFTIVICMLPKMSSLLLSSKRPTIDTSFKRAAGYEEFEIEAWFPSAMKSVVCCRGFITCQSAVAHLVLFRNIFRIAEEDTGQPVQFRHIHGVGIEIVAADAHKGQARGLGDFLREICCGINRTCTYDCACPLENMSAYDHLAHLYRLCTNHNGRGIHKISGEITESVKNAMYSLSTPYPLPDLQATISFIRTGGPKAEAWMDDKTKTTFVIPAIYRPASKIPLSVWLAAPATTNGNEQAHRNINRDGTRLSLLAATIRGLQYDTRHLATIDLFLKKGIFHRDQLPTHSFRANRAVLRGVNTQKRKLDGIEDTLVEIYKGLEDVIGEIASIEAPQPMKSRKKSTVKKPSGKHPPTLSQLYTKQDELQKRADELQDRSSGRILPPPLRPGAGPSIPTVPQLPLLLSMPQGAAAEAMLNFPNTSELTPDWELYFQNHTLPESEEQYRSRPFPLFRNDLNNLNHVGFESGCNLRAFYNREFY